MDRRRFLSTAAAGVAGAAHLNAFDMPKKRVALIGSGWYAKCDLFRLIQVAPVEVVSISDVDQKMLADAAEWISTRQLSKKKPRTYTDYRKQLAEKDIDIAIVGTPDHWHALGAIDAMKAGCDLYLQKPISVDVIEGEAILAAARKYGRVVQIGTQRRSTPHLIEAMEKYVRSGALGKIGLVEVYCYYPMRARDVGPDIAPPPHLDWEMWTGPAPKRGYNKVVHPRGWRAFMEYGNGILGDMCVHMLDMVRWMMKLGWPISVSSTGGILIDKESRATVSDTQVATFEFPEVRVVWTHRSYGHPPDPKYPWGATFYGDKGTLKTSVFSYDFIPTQGAPVHKDVTYEFEQFPEDRTEKDLERHVAPAIRGHMKDLMANIVTRGRPVADVEEGHISTASCVLANMSMKLGRSLKYDPKTRTIPGDPEATKLLRRPYRAPYVHPEPDKV
jgi:predicted dehydrogenase